MGLIITSKTKKTMVNRSTIFFISRILPPPAKLVNENFGAPMILTTTRPRPVELRQNKASIQNVKLLHGFHLYWPKLDVDLEIDNLENPEKYPLKSKR